MTPDDLDRLERLAEKCTPLPWAVDKTVALGAYGVWTDGTVLPEGEPMRRICSMIPHDNPDVPQRTRDANAALIVEAVNNLKSLLSAAREAGALARSLAVAQEQLESFPLRIYDTFTCPNCRGSKLQAPPFFGDGTEGPVPCEFCKGEGWTNFAEILKDFDKPREAGGLADDGELVTREWLAEVGFVEHEESLRDQKCYTTRGKEDRRSETCGVFLVANACKGPKCWNLSLINCGEWIKDNPTRRDVRRLCQSLGITLQEPPLSERVREFNGH
jgi:hypothetical protein